MIQKLTRKQIVTEIKSILKESKHSEVLKKQFLNFLMNRLSRADMMNAKKLFDEYCEEYYKEGWQEGYSASKAKFSDIKVAPRKYQSL